MWSFDGRAVQTEGLEQKVNKSLWGSRACFVSGTDRGWTGQRSLQDRVMSCVGDKVRILDFIRDLNKYDGGEGCQLKKKCTM